MDKGEIARDYARSKNHKRQIQILAELNACPKEKIVEILQEKGYKMVFNTNGVDISLKFEEIHAAYQSGKTIKELSKQYHVSVKGMREVLGITEDEVVSKEPVGVIEGNFPDANMLRAENEKLRAECAKLTEECAHLRAENERLEKCAASEKGLAESAGSIHEKYQAVCIKNSQLNATIDTLIDKISMLKAVGCNGR